MMYAVDEGERVPAAPGSQGKCPTCGAYVRPKCGSVVAWHWAHESNDCDPWTEPETGWHMWWKSAFPEQCREVARPPHRADIVTPKGIVLEVQHSTISAEDIREREAFYGPRMMWILDAREYADNFSVRNKSDHSTFRWKHPRKSFWSAARMIALDLGGRIFVIKKLHHDIPCGGWGNEYTPKEFLCRLGGHHDSCDELTQLWDGHRKWDQKMLAACRPPGCTLIDFDDAKWQSELWRFRAMSVQDGPPEQDR